MERPRTASGHRTEDLRTDRHRRAHFDGYRVGSSTAPNGGEEAPTLVFKDPYFLDFLDLRQGYQESDLEEAIRRKMEAFILELGRGFAFVERQKRIVLDGSVGTIQFLYRYTQLSSLCSMISESDLFEQLAAGPKRSSDLVSLGLTRGRLARLVAAGKVLQLARGLYGHPGQIPEDGDSLVLVARQAPKAVVCLLSALQFHGLTTQLPREVWVALEGKSHCPKVTTVRVRFHRFTGAGFQEGIELHPASGSVLRVYGVTKTVLDCFRMRNHVGLDVAIEALRDALRQRKTTIQKLDHLSRKLRIHSVVRPYLEMAASS